MKKLKKFLTTSIMVLVAFAMALAAPVLNVCRKVFASSKSYDYSSGQTAEHKQGATFSVNNIQKNWTIDDDVQVPKVDETTVRSIADGSVVTPQETKVVVYNPNGKALENLTDKTTHYEFKPSQIGTYKVEYAVKYNDVWTVANKYELKITASTYEYKFVENDPIILPATIDTKTEGVSNVTLPLPMVTVEGEQLKYFKVGSYTNKVLVAVYNEATYSYTVKQYEEWTDFKAEYEAANIGVTVEAETNVYTMIIEVNTDTKNYINNQAVVEAEGSEHETLAYHTSGANTNYYNFKAQEGSNVIRYRLVDNNKNTCYEESKKITGSNSYDSSKIDIGFTVNNATTKASLMDKTYLPLASAYDKNNANTPISVYTIIEVQRFVGKNAETGELEYESVAVSRDDEGVYFIPTETGDYEITYKVKDFYGHEGYSYNYTIKDVKDTVAPTLYIVDSYDIDDIENIKDDLKSQNYKYIVPTKYDLNTIEITLPAVYAEDSAKSNFKDLTIRRRITSSDFVTNNAGSIYLDTDTKYTVYDETTEYKNYDIKRVEENGKQVDKFYKKGTTTEVENVQAYKATQTATVKLDAEKFAAGNYTIYYTVSDGNGNTATWSTTLGLVDGFKDEVAPEIKYQTNQTVTVNNNEDVVFDAPTITDDTDSELVNKYYIYFANGTKINDIATTAPLYKEVFLNEDGKIEFNTAEIVANAKDVTEGGADKEYSIYDIARENGCTFTLVTYSFDDFALLKNGNIKTPAEIDALCRTIADPANVTLTNVGAKTTRFAVIDESDGFAPIIAGVAGTDLKNDFEFDPTVVTNYEQNGKIYVDGVKIWDNRKGLTIVAIIRDSNGNVVQAYNTLGKTTTTEVLKDAELNGTNLKAPADGYVYSIPGISFTASLCDSYTVTYVATDRAGYVSAYTAVLPKTVDTEAPVISGYKTSTYELELGQTLSLVDIVAKDNDKNNIKVEADCEDHSNYIHEIVDGIYEFAPQQTGTYTLTFDANDGTNKADQVTITVQVKHTVKPVIKLLSESVQTTYFGDKVDSKDFTEIYLPGYIVEDESESGFGFELDELKNYSEIKITGPVTFTEDAEDAKYKITYHEDGANNAKYSFKPTTKGTYTVTYSAWDEHNNEAEAKVIEITVGETVPPTINVADDLVELLDKEHLVGTTLTVDLSKVTVTDNIATYVDSEGETKDYEYKAEIQITDANGNVVNPDATDDTEEETEEDDNIKTYTFENAGEYTLTLTAKDAAGNNQVYTKTIKVVSEESKKTDVTTVVGTILIVVSLAILAGVIVYFARTPKTANMATTKAKKVEKKESKKDENKD